MKKPTTKEVEAEVATLKAMKPTVRRYSAFGDDHHNAIDAQIDVLESEMSEDEAYTEFEDEPDNVRDSAIEAIQWREGESEGRSPSKNWKPLVSKTKP